MAHLSPVGPGLSRRLRRAAALCGLAPVVVMAAAASCITLPPPPIDSPAPTPPTIIRENLSPPADRILTAWPPNGEFDVQVRPGLASDGFFCEAYVDYDTENVPQNDLIPPFSAAVSTIGTGGQPVTVPIVLSPGPMGPGCHKIEILVAHGFATGEAAPFLHTFDAVGGDSVVYFYAPSGTLAGCGGIAAATAPDAGGDAAADGGTDAPADALLEGGDR